MNTFPFDSWEEAASAAVDSGAGYFTWGPGGNAGTIILFILGFILMVAAIVAWITTEDAKLTEQAARLNDSGGS